MSTVITVAAGKGGTGKTTTVATVASCLAALGHKTLCIDFDRSTDNLESVLGIRGLKTIGERDVPGGLRWIVKACSEHPRIPNLYYLPPYAFRKTDRTSEEDAAALFFAIRMEFDYCVVDTPAVSAPSFKLAQIDSDVTVLVTNCEHPDMSDVRKAASFIADAGKCETMLLVNRYESKNAKWIKPAVKDVVEGMGMKLLGVIPEDKNVFKSLHMDIPLVLFYKKYSAYHFLDAARRLSGSDVPPRSRFGVSFASFNQARQTQPDVEPRPDVELQQDIEPPSGVDLQPDADLHKGIDEYPESYVQLELDMPSDADLQPDVELLQEVDLQAVPELLQEVDLQAVPDIPYDVDLPFEPGAPESVLGNARVRSFGNPDRWAKSTLPNGNPNALSRIYEVKEGIYTSAENIRDRIWLHDVLDDNDIPYYVEMEGYWPGRRKFVERQVIYVEEKNSPKAKRLIKEFNSSDYVLQEAISEGSQIVSIKDGIPQKLCPSCDTVIDFDFVVCPKCKTRI